MEYSAQLTHTEKRLIAMLKNIWDDEEFIIGVLSSVRTEEDQQLLIRHIENDDDVTSDSVLLLSMKIYRNRYGEPEYEDD